MRSFANMFRINGKPMFAPDADISMSFSDLDSDDGGRDEAGYMHRIVIRYKVGKWSFEYGSMTDEERRYMEELFPNASRFQFTHPDRLRTGETVTTWAYRSGYGIEWHNARTGQWRNYKFDIEEC